LSASVNTRLNLDFPRLLGRGENERVLTITKSSVSSRREIPLIIGPGGLSSTDAE